MKISTLSMQLVNSLPAFVVLHLCENNSIRIIALAETAEKADYLLVAGRAAANSPEYIRGFVLSPDSAIGLPIMISDVLQIDQMTLDAQNAMIVAALDAAKAAADAKIASDAAAAAAAPTYGG